LSSQLLVAHADVCGMASAGSGAPSAPASTTAAAKEAAAMRALDDSAEASARAEQRTARRRSGCGCDVAAHTARDGWQSAMVRERAKVRK
jgi:hypothetical protein